jgi:hypothetical protein
MFGTLRNTLFLLSSHALFLDYITTSPLCLIQDALCFVLSYLIAIGLTITLGIQESRLCMAYRSSLVSVPKLKKGECVVNISSQDAKI